MLFILHHTTLVIHAETGSQHQHLHSNLIHVMIDAFTHQPRTPPVNTAAWLLIHLVPYPPTPTSLHVTNKHTLERLLPDSYTLKQFS